MIFKSLPSIIIYIFFQPGRAGGQVHYVEYFADVWTAVQHQPSVQSLHMYGYVWTHTHQHLSLLDRPFWSLRAFLMHKDTNTYTHTLRKPWSRYFVAADAGFPANSSINE